MNLKKNLEYSYSIKQEETFKNDLKNIYKYIAYDLSEKRAAIKFVNTVISKLKNLQVFPYAYKLYKKEENFEYRKLIVKNYIIIYKINLKEKEIFILHIYNQKVNYHKKSILL